MLKILNEIKNIGITSIIAILIILGGFILGIMIFYTPRQIYAFPSAEGYGAYATGGRGGVVYHVKTLEDNNQLGSLRYAINQKGPRTIVFDVSGIIDLKSPLEIKENDLTIAGQSAPGEGVCIKGYPVIINADNIILRFLRFRLGTQGSALTAKNRHDIIIDHCSISWSGDENVSLYNNRRLTMQWSIISESLNNSGYGATLGGYSASYHHNLFASNNTNNPSFYKSQHTTLMDLETVDFRNNVLYNWGVSSINGAASGTYNLVNNYFKFGPATNIPSRSQIVDMTGAGRNGIVYVSGNFVHTSPLQTNDNWMGVYPNMDYMKTSKNPFLTRTEFYHDPITTQSAEIASKNVLKYAGASYKRDLPDSRISQSVETFVSGASTTNGLITSPSEVGGYPKYNSDVPKLDSDGDGLPDEYEFQHNLNPYDAGDGKSITKNGYTNLELYLNGIVSDIIAHENGISIPNIDMLKLLIQKMANKIKKH